MKADRYIIIALAAHRLTRNKEQEQPMLTDIQYALAQLRKFGNHGNPNVRADAQQRAIDALERVEVELRTAASQAELLTQPEPKTDSLHPSGL